MDLKRESGILSLLPPPRRDDLLSPRRSSGTIDKAISASAGDTAPSIRVGRAIVGSDADGPDSGETQLFVDARELSAHARKPWMAVHLAERHGIRLAPKSAGGRGGAARAGAVSIPEELLARHALVCGATGSGKTRLALHLLAEQVRLGCSVVAIDPKRETLAHLLDLCHATGLGPDAVTMLLPGDDRGSVPGWNPLDCTALGILPTEAAGDLVAVLESCTASWGPRLQDVLTNAAIIIASLNLSLLELARFLQRDDYREALLRHGDGEWVPDVLAWSEAREYFTREFALWSKSERVSAVAPVLNKIRDFLRNPFLRAFLCAKRNTLDLPSLWHRQQMVMVHLDRAALGDEGARLLGGLLSHQLYRTTMRVQGPRPVVLSLDEMGVAERFVGKAVVEILAIARSRKLRLLAACQHLDQLSDELRGALLANTAFQAFFRLGPPDARVVASFLSAGIGERISKVALDVVHSAKSSRLDRSEAIDLIEREKRRQPIVDPWGDKITVAPWAWAELDRLQTTPGVDAGKKLYALQVLLSAAGIPRAYVLSPVDGKSKDSSDGEAVEVSEYLKGLSSTDFLFHGPAPLGVTISFPKPKVTVLERQGEAARAQAQAKRLMELPVREAVLRMGGSLLGQVRVVDVPDGAVDLQGPVQRSGRQGQRPDEVEATYRWRQAQVERLAESIVPQESPATVPPKTASAIEAGKRRAAAATPPQNGADALASDTSASASSIDEQVAAILQAAQAQTAQDAVLAPTATTKKPNAPTQPVVKLSAGSERTMSPAPSARTTSPAPLPTTPLSTSSATSPTPLKSTPSRPARAKTAGTGTKAASSSKSHTAAKTKVKPETEEAAQVKVAEVIFAQPEATADGSL